MGGVGGVTDQPKQCALTAAASGPSSLADPSMRRCSSPPTIKVWDLDDTRLPPRASVINLLAHTHPHKAPDVLPRLPWAMSLWGSNLAVLRQNDLFICELGGYSLLSLPHLAP